MEEQESYAAWQRYLWAVALCWKACDGKPHDRLDTLEAIETDFYSLPEVVQDCCYAVGITKRAGLQWKQHPLATTYELWHVKGATSVCRQEGNGNWMADYGNFVVTGHPNRESAIQHLDYLIARRTSFEARLDRWVAEGKFD